MPIERDPRRSRRRQDRARMIARARMVVSSWADRDDEAFIQSWALRNHDHLKRCSCALCSNPRHRDGERTLQEVRAGFGGDHRHPIIDQEGG